MKSASLIVCMNVGVKNMLQSISLKSG